MTAASLQALERFHYDSMDRVVAVLSPGQPGAQRFYKDALLANALNAGQQRCHVRMADHLLCVRDTAAGVSATTLLGSEQQGSVLRTALPGATHWVAYTPYGEGADPLLPGFNGQQTEPAAGFYLLGNGYRAYNPRLMRFNSPDSFSPFEGAGLNPYTYCLGDPINRSDPTGHISLGGWIGIAVGAVIVVTGLVILAIAAGPFVLAAMAGGMMAAPALTIGTVAAITAGALTVGSGSFAIASAGLREKDIHSDAATNLGSIAQGLGIAAAVIGGIGALNTAYDKALASAFQSYAKTAGRAAAGAASQGTGPALLMLPADELMAAALSAPSLGTRLLQPFAQLGRNAASLTTQLQNPRVISAAEHFAKAMAKNLVPRIPGFGKPAGKGGNPAWHAPGAEAAGSAPTPAAQASRLRTVTVADRRGPGSQHA